MSETCYGANLEDWQLLIDLELVEDLLPVVSNPNAEVSAKSNLKQIGKVPSLYNKEGKVAGIADWTSKNATDDEVERWSLQRDYGICLQTRRVRGIDIDVENSSKSEEIVDFVEETLGISLPRRFRAGTGKCLLALCVDSEFGKQSVKVPGGAVEFLSNGNQFIAFGTHPSGTRYEWVWPSGGAHEFPVVEESIYKELITAIERRFGKVQDGVQNNTGETGNSSSPPSQYRARRPKIPPRQGSEGRAGLEDSYSAALARKGLVLGRGRSGEVYLRCPWRALHTSDSGVTETAYFPAGGRGYDLGHFKCLHDHCHGRKDEEFAEALGLMDDEFEVIESVGGCAAASKKRGINMTENETSTGYEAFGSAPAREDDGGDEEVGGNGPVLVAGTEAGSSIIDRPRFARDNTGKIWPTIDNLYMAVGREDVCGFRIAFDTFLDDVMIAAEGEETWRSLQDIDYTMIQKHLERVIGFKPISFDLLRRAIDAVAWSTKFDSAIDWLTGLKWDEKPRVDTFMVDCFGTVDTPYARAVSQYMWTAMAGRVLKPGIKADMIPIFEGSQGTIKSTLISALVPREEFFAELSFDQSDADLSRLMRGKLVAEIPELKGLAAKNSENIKAFLTRRYEHWVPKYKEKSITFPRRLIFIGTTNEKEILGDKTGHRRFLPIRIEKANIDRVRDDRDQLWAEARERFERFGIEYQDAERLAKDEHIAYEINDEWENLISTWLHTPDVGTGLSPMDRDYLIMSQIIYEVFGVAKHLLRGYEERKVGLIMRKNGFDRFVLRVNGVSTKVWQKRN